VSLGQDDRVFNSGQSGSMPKKQIAIFVLIDLILVAAVIFAVFHHMRIVPAMIAFTVLSVINGVFLIITVVKSTSTRT
jgi:hypothetical protein